MRLRFRSLAVPVLISAFVVPSLYATTTFDLPWWMGTSTLTTFSTTPVVDTSTSLTTTTTVNNGFTGSGTTTQPVLATTTTLTTTTTTQNMTVLSPSPAPIQTTSSSTPWWMSFSTFGTYSPLIQQTPLSSATSPLVTPGTSTLGQTVQPYDVPISNDVGVPEPATVSIFVGGLACLWMYRRRAISQRP
jgi:hypothetical protein